jgi:N-acetylmuramoyl-L-alanine amidase
MSIRIGFLVLLRFLLPKYLPSMRLTLCVLVFCCVDIVQAATVKSVRIWRGDIYTRVVLDLDAPVRYNLVLANNPTRIIVDLSGSQLKGAINKLPLAGTPIEIVRSSVVNDADLRLVFDLKRAVSPKSFVLKKTDTSDDRLVIDLYDAAPEVTQPKTAAPTDEPVNIESVMGGDLPATPESPASAPATAPASETDNATLEPKPVNGRTILIAVDAGHGGADSGALGPQKMREKDVTLAIAKELVRVINAQPGYSARLTRTGDYFVELKKRRDFARNMKADLFISIHADSFTEPSAYGASVFALSRKGATSEMARFLAQRENDSDLIGRVGGVSLEDKDPQLAGVLVDLSMTATVNSSLQVGSKVLNAISAIAPLHAKHVEQAGFMVLKSPDVPSILVETGFISNAAESKKLASPDYREKMAQAVFKGVRQYFAQHPPLSPVSPATVAERAPVQKNVPAKKASEQTSKKVASVASRSSPERKHVVAAGDTLTGIAVQYKVSAAKIRTANNMKNDVVKLGQTLKIPAQ